MLIGLNRWCHLKYLEIMSGAMMLDIVWRCQFQLIWRWNWPLGRGSMHIQSPKQVEVLHVDPCSVPHVCCDFTLRYRWRWTHDSTGQDTAIALRSKRSKDRLWDPEGQRLYDKLLQSVPCLRWCQVHPGARCDHSMSSHGISWHPTGVGARASRLSCVAWLQTVCWVHVECMSSACRSYCYSMVFNYFLIAKLGHPTVMSS